MNDSPDFIQELQKTARLIDTKLRLLLDKEFPPTQDSAAQNRLGEAMAYGVFSGGKRLRPFLVLQCARLLGAKWDGESGFLSVAAAVEIIHAYSLIHDDLPAMDNSALRRGRAALHIAFDEATAILAGDGLLTLAFGVICQADDLGCETRLAILDILAKGAGVDGMIGGQMCDLTLQECCDEAELIARDRRKTGALICSACLIGGVLAGAGEEEMVQLRAYGDDLGLAFQIRDDILDWPEKGESCNYVTILGKEGAQARAEAVADTACLHIRHFGARAQILLACVRFAAHRDQ